MATLSQVEEERMKVKITPPSPFKLFPEANLEPLQRLPVNYSKLYTSKLEKGYIGRATVHVHVCYSYSSLVYIQALF